MRIVPAAFLITAVLIAAVLPCQSAPREGHSHQGEAFNEGPRQAACLMGTTGDVHFPVTVASELAQRFFDQGIGQLHGFWYFEAERCFRQVASIDPDCAMAYWGMAMANLENQERARGFAYEAWRRRHRASERERMHIEALARYHEAAAAPGPDGKRPKLAGDDKARRQRYVEDLERIVEAAPDDIETKAFLVNQLWLDMRDASVPIRSRQANDALLAQVFAASPMHPAHHYRVHLWDNERTSHRTIDSAAALGHTAPGVAHMWHMAGHVWAQLDRHDDAAWQQEASARVDHAHMMRDRVLPDQIHNYAHNNEWLIRSLRQVGRVREAIGLAKNMIELPRHPKWNTGKERDSTHYGRLRLGETLAQFELWDELLALESTMYLEPGDEPQNRAARLLLLAIAAIEKGDVAAAEARLLAMREEIAAEQTLRAKDVDTAEDEAIAAGKTDAEVEGAILEATKKHARPLRSVRNSVLELEGRLACAKGDFATGLERLAKAGADKIVRSRLCLAAGRPDEARKLACEARHGKDGEALPLANLIHVLHAIGEHAEAKTWFAELRAMSARFDLDLPSFQRLAPLVRELGLPRDWRVPYTVPTDVGVRPPLDSLGPLHWSPVAAPDWRLPTGLGGDVALADFRGRPVLMVLFLGFGCVHCVEQLNAFAPVAAEFRAAGIDLVAIGTDTEEQLAKSQRGDTGEDRFPFRIAADPGLDVFERYRCYDDFEKLALHGTFLIDGQGLVRWQDIGFEPFMDHAFVLKEAKRLLALPVSQ
jgi:peroxiredoxin